MKGQGEPRAEAPLGIEQRREIPRYAGRPFVRKTNGRKESACSARNDTHVFADRPGEEARLRRRPLQGAEQAGQAEEGGAGLRQG
jgi:hypothetical protein